MAKSLVGGQVEGLTELLYEAREKALERIEIAADQCNADEVVGVKTKIYDLGGGLVEFMVIGTAIKKFENITTKNENLIPQAIIQDRETFIDSTQETTNLSEGTSASARKTQAGPVAILISILLFFFYVFQFFVRHIATSHH